MFLITRSFLIRGAIIGVALILLLLVFKLGVLVGYRKAFHSYRWGEMRKPVLDGKFRKGPAGVRDRDLMNAHGLTGTIVRIEGNTITLKEETNAEQEIVVDENTMVRRGRASMTVREMVLNDHITVIGEPTQDGVIQAKFIRVF